MESRRPALIVLLLTIAAASISVGLMERSSAARARIQSATKSSQPSVGTTFKNIQALTDLKDQPPAKLYDAMQFMAGSLSVSCNYCHVSEHGPFDSDAKKTKQIARRMIQMTRAINANSFGGQQVVTCNTCHQGSLRPNAVPSPWYKTAEQVAQYNQEAIANSTGSTSSPARTATIAESTAASLPSVDQIMEKYRQAVGADGLKSLSLKGTNLVAVGANFKPVPFEVDFSLPEQALVSQGSPGSESKLIVNGAHVWRATPQGATPLPAAQASAFRGRIQEFIPVKDLLSSAAAKVNGVETIGSKSYYVVEANLPAGLDKLFFDENSGLLYKSRLEAATALGTKVEEQTFEDYRKVNGVMLAFLITNHYMEEESVYRISGAETNVAFAPAMFEPVSEGKSK